MAKSKKLSKRKHEQYILLLTRQMQDKEMASKLNSDPELCEVFKADAAILEAKIRQSKAVYEGTPESLNSFKDYLRDWTRKWCNPEESARFDEYFLEKYGI